MSEQPKSGLNLQSKSQSTRVIRTDSSTEKVESNAGMKFNLGKLKDPPHTEFEATPEQLFGRHWAVIGATGGGKSRKTFRRML